MPQLERKYSYINQFDKEGEALVEERRGKEIYQRKTGVVKLETKYI